MTTRHDPLPTLSTVLSRAVIGWLACSAGAAPGAAERGLRKGPKNAGNLFEHASNLTGESYLKRHLSGKNDVCIVDLRMPSTDAYAVLSSANHHKYAKHHNYKHFSFEGRMSGEMFVDAERGPLTDVRGGGLYWQELPALAWTALQKNEDGSKACRWMMWMDNDAVFTNFKVTIESVVRFFAETDGVSKDAILASESTDYPSSFINAGVFLVKNSPGGRDFLSAVADSFDFYKEPGKFDDQGAIAGYAFQRDPSGLPMSERGRMMTTLRTNIAVVPQRVMNSFYWTGDTGHDAHKSVESEWQPCDWVLHIASRNAAERALFIESKTRFISRC